ncbi:ABC transporter ATP-binding protein [Paenibacillus endoradicis]|uniref:ABC transporter ATP-binding protein n=1 Tax=Paenibacillus endoradicis TaxID=2972487 RepID=UPI0021599EFD|nr:ABC transporter ATP-binding protein [Paenibacillus endoradicis]MCR8655784.1 ABC transporter ATP-binding protein [Paenibacillus endoradicis]MCR8658110.1 ABC transporter ATP-binding protein [Paenibacillus endoradicis]
MLLEMDSITKSYGSVTANHNVNFNLRKGEVHALIGENGAGKTTLMRILYGMERPTSGEIRIDGKAVTFNDPTDAIGQNIGMVHQHFMLFSAFTIAENIVIGREPSKGVKFDRKTAIEETLKLSERYGMPVNPKHKVADCSLGMQQRVEILKVLYQGAEIIILDEPTGVLTPIEVKELLISIKKLAASGKSFIIISHKLSEIMEVADRITVLRDGHITGTVNAADTNEEELSKMMVGRDLVKLERRKLEYGDPVLNVQSLSIKGNKAKPLLDNINFNVREGEIVGIAGISGNGQSELLQAISGLMPYSQGTITIQGMNVTGASVKQIRESGLAHIPEDRYLWGVSKDATVSDNGIMGHLDSTSKYGVLQGKLIRDLVSEWVQRFGIKTGSLSTKAQYLSGGNLQKLIVARELAKQTPFLIAAEPTRGVDVGAMEIIHGELLKRRDEKAGILLVSSELTEIMKLSDRILVMYEGKIAGELDAAVATEEQISLLMAGGKAVG